MNLMSSILRGDLDRSTADRLIQSRRVACDIETSGLDWRQASIGTVQFYTPDTGCIVVQTGAIRPAHICRVLESAEVLKVFHYAMFDLSFMASHWKVSPRRVACTKVASKLLTPGAPNAHHSLQALLAQQMHITISKEQRVTDWLASELTPAQVEYACRDVLYLLPLLDKLRLELEARGLVETLEACLDFLPTRVKLTIGGWPDVFSY
jgi:ribonuclease D